MMAYMARVSVVLYCPECDLPMYGSLDRHTTLCYNPECSLCGRRFRAPRIQLELIPVLEEEQQVEPLPRGEEYK